MRSRTIIFIPDPFEKRRLPLGVIAQHGERVIFEPTPLPDDIERTAAEIARIEADNLRDEPSAERPEWLGPHVVYGPWHEPTKSLSLEVYEAVGRASDALELRAEIGALLVKGREEADAFSAVANALPGHYR